MKEPEIQDIVQRAQRGDSDAFGLLFEQFSDRIYRFLILRVSAREVAEDLTQTVFLEMIQSLPRYKKQRTAKFSTWLFQIARFRLIDHYRAEKRHVPLDEAPEPAEDPSYPDPAADEGLLRALEKLPEQQRAVLHLHFFEDLKPKEIAEVLGLTPANVRVIQHRAITQLRTQLLP